jgi:hypothetical protein
MRLLSLGYLHVIFTIKAKTNLTKSELLHATKMKGDKRAFSYCKKILLKKIHSKISITDST